MMTSTQVFETSVNVVTNSPSQDYIHPDDHNLPTYVLLVVHCIVPQDNAMMLSLSNLVLTVVNVMSK